MLETLSYIGEKLNNAGILWAVGASIVLTNYGLVEKPNDIDILVDINDIKKADEILKGVGMKKPLKDGESTIYSTKYFYEYIVNGIDVDVMAGFAINFNEGTYEYSFDKKAVTYSMKANGVEIPLTSLEDWYVLYQLMPDREKKVKIIEKYLLSNGIKETHLINRALDKKLPNKIRERIELLIRSQKK
ncbi:hypothetical protein [Candidatus Clostridium stratigraminis]|uniref:Nucleotidyltransferase n=1 Tax=Candidatus Clostridium stratigraminis TaxID=3381661 RepID=A0ABW8T8H4_9CLOT